MNKEYILSRLEDEGTSSGGNSAICLALRYIIESLEQLSQSAGNVSKESAYPPDVSKKEENIGMKEPAVKEDEVVVCALCDMRVFESAIIRHYQQYHPGENPQYRPPNAKQEPAGKEEDFFNLERNIQLFPLPICFDPVEERALLQERERKIRKFMAEPSKQEYCVYCWGLGKNQIHRSEPCEKCEGKGFQPSPQDPG